MGRFKEILYSFLAVFSLSLSTNVQAESSLPDCRVDGEGNVVAVWSSIDGNFNNIVQAKIKPATATNWPTTATNLSYEISQDISNDSPMLYRNAQGHIVAVWKYFDPTPSKGFVAAAILEQGESTWIVKDVSQGIGNAFGDQKASINDTGLIQIVWTAYVGSNPVILTSFFQIGTSMEWEEPVQISDET